jgi:hypothetical protein
VPPVEAATARILHPLAPDAGREGDGRGDADEEAVDDERAESRPNRDDDPQGNEGGDHDAKRHPRMVARRVGLG